MNLAIHWRPLFKLMQSKVLIQIRLWKILGLIWESAIQTLSSHYGTRKTDQFLGQEAHAPLLFDKTAAEAEFQAFKHQMFMIR